MQVNTNYVYIAILIFTHNDGYDKTITVVFKNTVDCTVCLIAGVHNVVYR